MRYLAAMLSLFAVLAVSVQPAPAGVAVEFTPVVGHLAPLNSQIANNDQPLTIRQGPSTAYGGRIVCWFVPRVGVEAGILDGSSGLGVGATTNVTDHVRLRFDVKDHIHHMSFDIDPTLFGGAPIGDRTQHDLVVAAGLVMPVWGK